MSSITLVFIYCVVIAPLTISVALAIAAQRAYNRRVNEITPKPVRPDWIYSQRK